MQVKQKILHRFDDYGGPPEMSWRAGLWPAGRRLSTPALNVAESQLERAGHFLDATQSTVARHSATLDTKAPYDALPLGGPTVVQADRLVRRCTTP